jgi:hypothetical protein
VAPLTDNQWISMFDRRFVEALNNVIYWEEISEEMSDEEADQPSDKSADDSDDFDE